MTAKAWVRWVTVLVLAAGASGGTVGAVESETTDSALFQVRIERAHTSLPGRHQMLSVTLDRGADRMASFDLLINYDPGMVTFLGARAGDVFGDR